MSPSSCDAQKQIFDELAEELEELHIKFNALRQRQVGTPINGIGLPPHISFPCVGAGLAAAAGVLFPPEGTTDLRTGRADVHVGSTAVRALMRQEFLHLPQVNKGSW